MTPDSNFSSEPGPKLDPPQQEGAGSITAELIGCRGQYEQLEIGYHYQVHTYNEAHYHLAQEIFGLADPLREKDEWDEFISAPCWEGRKPPKGRDQTNAFRHAVRFVLQPNASRQTVSHWTIPLEVLRQDGVPQTEIAKALQDRGGFQQICRERARAKRQQRLDDSPNCVKLFKRPPAVLPASLRDAIIITGEDGKTRIEDSEHRRLLVLVLPPHLELNLEPGELHLSALFAEDDNSTLDVTGLSTEVPIALMHLRKHSGLDEAADERCSPRVIEHS
jgi:hypothetical protein